MGIKKQFVVLILIFANVFSLKGQSKDDTRSAARRFADSMYYAHTVKPREDKARLDVEAADKAKNEISPKYISNKNEIPASTLYQSTWYNERVKIPDFSFSDVPDEIVLRLINERKGQKFCFPIKNVKTSSYGWRWGRPHTGIDLALKTGDSVYAAFDGVVRLSKYNGGYGNCVVIRHYNSLETLYGHLSKLLVKVGQKVKAGEVIGLGGSTGHSTGPHLHFECRLMYACFDPEWIFDLETFSIKTSFVSIDKSYFGVEPSEKKANKKSAKSRLSKVDVFFEDRPYVKTSAILAKERKLIKEGKKPQYMTFNSSSQGKNANYVYIVAQKGDRLKDIAKRYGISFESLKQMNPEVGNKIREKTKIRIK